MSIKIGMVGLDTSHSVAFAELLNDENNEHHIPGCKVVKAFPGGSKGVSFSAEQVAQYQIEITRFGVELVNSIEDLNGLDAYLLESVDGLQHLEQFKNLANFRKPVFIDKPLACDYASAQKIVKLAMEHKIPVMSSSAIRFTRNFTELVSPEESVASCDVFGPMFILDDYRDYFWYGIHSIETLFNFMGTGCRSVQAVCAAGGDVLVGIWNDGRSGVVHGNTAGVYQFGASVIVKDKGARSAIAVYDVPPYKPLVKKIADFFQSGISSIDMNVTMEAIAFMEAASRSRVSGGRVILFSEIV